MYLGSQRRHLADTSAEIALGSFQRLFQQLLCSRDDTRQQRSSRLQIVPQECQQ